MKSHLNVDDLMQMTVLWMLRPSSLYTFAVSSRYVSSGISPKHLSPSPPSSDVLASSSTSLDEQSAFR
jgi:hypothetical protein